MSNAHRFCDILVAGAGPAGMAAAVSARKTGANVLVLDDNPRVGGQIWRGGEHHPSSVQAASWFRKFQSCGADAMPGAPVIGGDMKQRFLIVETQNEAFEIRFDKLILTTGAREFFLPFPGWTLPNIIGVGGLQALVKSGLPVKKKRIIVAGTGPLLLAAAAYLTQQGATVPIIAEQADARGIARFALQLPRSPGKLSQAAALRFAVRDSRYLLSCWVEAAHGHGRVETVRLRQRERVWDETCDYLAIAYGFKPNLELPMLLGCKTRDGAIEVDAFQQSSQLAVYCAGECTGIGGVDKSLIEGEIAGYAAAGQNELAERLFERRNKARQFAAALERTFAVRNELRSLPSHDTIICRCEDVTWERLQTMASWRSAKLHTRCGMGPCQGRICGPILEFLLGLHPDSVRPPIFPARVETLISINELEERVLK